MVEDIFVSTVFLSLAVPSAAFFLGIEDPAPILYETMTFGVENETGGPWRYATRAEALEGHAQVVAQVRELLVAELRDHLRWLMDHDGVVRDLSVMLEENRRLREACPKPPGSDSPGKH